ncbi:glutathione S-transferase T3-like [Eutrema salsugineum]|uniref:glutathione S-transferase T3-like n=1 Tax=Eutrema salsugineum TaxID=72664 RepID=UPI000CED214D|nr:glutathione S-transferase T3-like [Eutrema salsugineum]
MDSTNGFVNHSFVNLLTSQEDNPYGYSQTIDLRSPEVPRFSSQEDPTLTKDPVVGNDQKAGAFWKRIQAYFNASPQVVGQPREASHCKQRWGRLNDQVCKFVGAYEAIMKEQSSGQNENDVVKAAHQIFFNDHQFKFGLDHAWRELRHNQKWCSASAIKDAELKKRKKFGDSTVQDPTSVSECHGDDSPVRRPVGVKAAKAAKGKKSSSQKPDDVDKGKGLLQVQSMFELRQQDMDYREKLSNRKLLQCLLSKTEPLTETELALKDKLIADILS